MRKSEHIITFRHYIVLTVIAFAAGIICATAYKQEYIVKLMKLSLIFLFVLGVIVLILKISSLKQRVPIKPFILASFLTVCMLAGIFRIIGEQHYFPNALHSYAGKGAWLTGTVETTPRSTQKGYSYFFQMEVKKINDTNIDSENIIIFAPQKQAQKISEGSSICCWTKINSPSAKDQNWPYDYETHLQGKDIFFSGSTKNLNFVTPDNSKSLVSAVSDLGHRTANTVVSAIDQLPVNNKTNTNILKGILVGDKADFSDELYQQFSFAGLSHIVAVSGMHLSILFAVITLILSKLRIRKRLSVFISVPLVILFAATANFTPSVCRAAIMIIMMLIGMLFQRRYSPINALFLSLGIILFIFPYSIYSRSLTLSFCATLGILVYYKYIYYFMKKLISSINFKSEVINNPISYMLNFVISSISISLSVTIATAYFSLKLFGTLSWIQFITNIWIIPAVTAVFCIGFLACITYYILPPVAGILTHPLNFFLSIISKTAETFGQSQFTFQLNSTQIPWKHLVTYLGIAIFIYLLLKTAYDLSKETERAKPLPAYLYREKLPKL